MDILVVGNANCDRILRLAEPLAPGGRHPLVSATERTGGAGYHAAAAIAQLGGRAVLSGRIAGDPRGERLLADVRARGIATDLIVREHAATTPFEILVEPDGRRTILFEPRAGAPAVWPRDDGASFAGLYVNTATAMPAAAAALVRDGGPILAQLPMRSVEATHPTPLLVASADESPELAPAGVWSLAARVSGGRAQRVILTDGPRPIRIVAAAGVVDTVAVEGRFAGDTTGAGDFFAGALVLHLARGMDLPGACEAAGRDTAGLLEARALWG